MPDVANGRDFNWPAGARCAFSISWDVDVDSMLHLQHGDRAYEQYAALSYLRYDEVAIPNIVRACAATRHSQHVLRAGLVRGAVPRDVRDNRCRRPRSRLSRLHA